MCYLKKKLWSGRAGQSFFYTQTLHFKCHLCKVKNQGRDETGKGCLQLLLRRHNELRFPLLTLLARSYADHVVQVTCLVCRETADLSQISFLSQKQIHVTGWPGWSRSRFCFRICKMSSFSKGAGITQGDKLKQAVEGICSYKRPKCDKMRTPSPQVQARLAASAGCHHVWFETLDCNSKRRRCVFPKALQAICRGVYRSCACL